MKWIDVREKLPEDNNLYMITVAIKDEWEDKENYSIGAELARYMNIPSEEKLLWVDDFRDPIEFCDITPDGVSYCRVVAWAPLPKAYDPKEKGGAK